MADSQRVQAASREALTWQAYRPRLARLNELAELVQVFRV